MKDVLPALCAVDYSDLSIQDGIAASRAFLGMISDEVSRDQRKKIRSELAADCGRDTYGMVLILTALKRFIETVKWELKVWLSFEGFPTYIGFTSPIFVRKQSLRYRKGKVSMSIQDKLWFRSQAL